jgi:hypothetical protein
MPVKTIIARKAATHVPITPDNVSAILGRIEDVENWNFKVINRANLLPYLRKG